MAPAECLAEGVVALDQSCHTNSLAHSNMVTVCVCVWRGHHSQRWWAKRALTLWATFVDKTVTLETGEPG